MKSNWILTVIAVALFALIGCGKKNQVDTAPIEKSFASAEPGTKSSADQAVSAIKAGNYSGALAELQKLGAQAKLTPEQKQAIQDVIAQVQKQLSEAVGQAGKEAEKAAGDLQKSLKK